MIDLKELKRVSRIRLRHEMADPIAVADELAALKRDRERLRNMEREVARLQKDNARMRPVFDAARKWIYAKVRSHQVNAKVDDFRDEHLCSNDLLDAVRKLDR